MCPFEVLELDFFEKLPCTFKAVVALAVYDFLSSWCQSNQDIIILSLVKALRLIFHLLD